MHVNCGHKSETAQVNFESGAWVMATQSPSRIDDRFFRNPASESGDYDRRRFDLNVCLKFRVTINF